MVNFNNVNLPGYKLGNPGNINLGDIKVADINSYSVNLFSRGVPS